MKYSFEKSLEILERTPFVFEQLLRGVHDDWINTNEGPGTFSPFDVLGHLIHGERTDWPTRIQCILEHGESKTFEPYDRFAMYKESKGKNIDQLLDEFKIIRRQNLSWFRSLGLKDADLGRKGSHPNLGIVTLEQILSTWPIHDLTHIAQVSRVMAKQYKENMGPWLQYFRLLDF